MRSFGTSVSGKKVMAILHGRHSNYMQHCIYSILSGFNMIDCTYSFIQNYSIEWEYPGIHIFHLHFIFYCLKKKVSLVMQYAEQTSKAHDSGSRAVGGSQSQDLGILD
jgi:hypothetical protein